VTSSDSLRGKSKSRGTPLSTQELKQLTDQELAELRVVIQNWIVYHEEDLTLVNLEIDRRKLFDSQKARERFDREAD
jgi:hypothetical protein